MKKFLFFTITFLIFMSCNNKKEVMYIENSLPNGYSIEIPSDYSKYGQNDNNLVWKSGEKSFLFIQVINMKSDNLMQELKSYSSNRISKELYKTVRMVNNQTFEKNGLRGVISYYKNDLKGNRLGLVTLTTYSVFAIVQNENIQFRIESSALSNNNFDEITESIKSIISDSKIIPEKSNLNTNHSKIIDSISKTYVDQEKKLQKRYDSIKRINNIYAKKIDSLKVVQNDLSIKTNEVISEKDNRKSDHENQKIILFLEDHYKFYERDSKFRNPIVKKIDDHNFEVSIEESSITNKSNDDFFYRGKVIRITQNTDGSLRVKKWNER